MSAPAPAIPSLRSAALLDSVIASRPSVPPRMQSHPRVVQGQGSDAMVATKCGKVSSNCAFMS